MFAANGPTALLPSVTAIVNAGATPEPSGTNCTWPATTWAWVKLVIGAPGLETSWK